jgi:hypothetical protein
MKKDIVPATKSIEVPKSVPGDFLWGANQIARHLRLKRSQVYYLLRTGAIPHRKLGPKTIVARKSELDDFELWAEWTKPENE